MTDRFFSWRMGFVAGLIVGVVGLSVGLAFMPERPQRQCDCEALPPAYRGEPLDRRLQVMLREVDTVYRQAVKIRGHLDAWVADIDRDAGLIPVASDRREVRGLIYTGRDDFRCQIERLGPAVFEATMIASEWRGE